MVSFIFIFGYTARAETKVIESENGQTCAQICEADEGEHGEPLYCVSTTVENDYSDNRYCKINEDDPEHGGGDFCERYVSGCNTVMNDDGFGGCTNVYSDGKCFEQSYRQASWANCICRTSETPLLNHVGTGDDASVNIGAGNGVVSNNYIYQPFAFPTNNIGKITRFSTFLGTTGWDGSYDDMLNAPFFQIGFLFAGSANDCFDYEVEKYTDCVFGCGEDMQLDMYGVPTNDGTLIAENYWEFNGTSENPIYDSANPISGKEFFCGVGIYSYKYEEAGTSTGMIVLANADDDLLDSYNFYTSESETPLSFKLFGEEPIIATTTCGCEDIMASSTGWVDDISNGIQCSFRQLTCWMLTPNAESLSNFANSTHSLSESFPFNTLYGLTNPIKESADIEMVSTSTSNLKMPMVNKTGHYYLLTVASSTSVSNLIGNTNTNNWRVGIAYVMWAITAGLIAMIIF